ncbi:pre-mRNA-processing factor 39 isoform X1 [Euwallacea fornicatus]|uniref:pre-mRNA-processing factor 39 isoform X1 n=1 Tax=Euwallacea fornicatus TaxID=995702 RepID=UPI00338EE6B6
MSDVEDDGSSRVRKTRSGRAVKTPAKPKPSAKSSSRKPYKKVAVLEVDPRDEEDFQQPLTTDNEEPAFKKAKLDEEKLLEDSENEEVEENVITDNLLLLNSGDEADTGKNDSNKLVLNDVTMLDDYEGISKDHKRVEEVVTDDLLAEMSSENGMTNHKLEERKTQGKWKTSVKEEVSTTENPKHGEAVRSKQETTQDQDTTIEEDIVYPAQNGGDPEAENISDDELPAVPVVKVPETEEVSDEELPGPKRAELPADTEVVSEDELPVPSKKEAEEEEEDGSKKNNKEDGKRKLSETGYDPTSPTSENEAPVKKPKDDKEDREKDGENSKVAKPKKLPELDKYWKAVNDDPTDFTGWTYLLQYVDQENDMEAAREAYDAFLSHYPYCYGYWRKYADYEKRKGNKKKCEEVFERGLKAIPLSVDLWIHYLTYVKSSKGDDEEYVRSQFERALSSCGLEFRSDRLWDSYVKWESDAKRLQKVTALYERLLSTPTQCYTTHFDNFQEHVAAHPPNKILDVDEFMALRKEVRTMLKSEEKAADNADLPPGDEDSKLYTTEEETKSIRERIVSIRRKLHKNTVNAVTARWNFEEGIKRPYFHVKPLERCQLKNWQDYLDYEIEQGDLPRITVLFERCLIACALYEEFWLKFVSYLESLNDPEMQPKIRDVYERACTIHHLKKPNLHLQWAMFEETCENVNRAAEILVNLEKQVPNVLQVAYRRINLERRRGDFDKCRQLFEHYISSSKNKMVSSNISIKYSRFSLRVLKDYDKAREILKAAIARDSNNPRLYLQLVDLMLQKETAEEDVLAVFDEFLDKEQGVEPEQKALFAQRKFEYLEDMGSGVEGLRKAQEQYYKLHKICKESSKKKDSKSEGGTSVSSKKEKMSTSSSSATTTAQSQSYGNYNYGNSSGQAPYNYSGSQQGQYNYPQYGQGDQYQYQNWQYQQGGAYSGYSQWGGYTGGYGY